MPSDVIRGWIPVRRQKMRPNKEKRAKPHSIKTGFALSQPRRLSVCGKVRAKAIRNCTPVGVSCRQVVALSNFMVAKFRSSQTPIMRPRYWLSQTAGPHHCRLTGPASPLGPRDAPRILNRRNAPQGITPIDAVMHEEALEERTHDTNHI